MSSDYDDGDDDDDDADVIPIYDQKKSIFAIV